MTLTHPYPRRLLLGHAVLLVVLFAVIPSVFGGSEGEPSGWEKFKRNWEVNGYLENETALRFRDPNHFSKVRNRLQLELRGKPEEWLEVYLLAWATYDATYDIYADDYTDPVRDEYRSNFGSGDTFDETFREIYVDLFLEFMDLRIGRQQVIWGEAIGLRITDVINPQDFREFILDDFADSRVPLWMAKGDLFMGDWTLELLWIPFFKPNKPALDGSEWEWTFSRIRVPPGVRLLEKAAETPDSSLDNSEFGARFSGLFKGWDLAVSYLYAWDRWPARHKRFDPATFTLTVEPRYHRTHVFGLTLVNAFGPFVPRAEISYHVGKYFDSMDPADPDGTVKKDFLYYMLGTDYQISGYLFNLQFVQKVITDYSEGIFEEEVQNVFSLWVQTSLMNETLKPELLVIYDANQGAWLIRPKMVYDYSDHVTLTLGIDFFEGRPDSFFGQMDDNDRIFVEAKYSF